MGCLVFYVQCTLPVRPSRKPDCTRFNLRLEPQQSLKYSLVLLISQDHESMIDSRGAK